MEKLLNIDSISPWVWYECQMPYHYMGAECPTIKMLLILETQINNIKQVSIVPPTVVWSLLFSPRDTLFLFHQFIYLASSPKHQEFWHSNSPTSAPVLCLYQNHLSEVYILKYSSKIVEAQYTIKVTSKVRACHSAQNCPRLTRGCEFIVIFSCFWFQLVTWHCFHWESFLQNLSHCYWFFLLSLFIEMTAILTSTHGTHAIDGSSCLLFVKGASLLKASRTRSKREKAFLSSYLQTHIWSNDSVNEIRLTLAAMMDCMNCINGHQHSSVLSLILSALHSSTSQDYYET